MKPIVAIIMGSTSDYEVMKKACEMLDLLQIPYEKEVVSAHRTPEKLYSFAKEAIAKGLKVIIAGAGGAAHLPGMVASMTVLPVIGVPIHTKSLEGIDSLLSIMQMPSGIPVATVAINNATNAALLAASMIGIEDKVVQERLIKYRNDVTNKVLMDKLP